MQTEVVSRDTISAGFGERFVAALIDGVILVVPNIIVSLILPQALAFVVTALIGVSYAAYFWTTKGSTPGKSVMGLKVVKADGGGLLDTGTAVLRYVGYYVSGIPLALGYLWAIWDPKHDTWHDKIAATKVIKVQK